VATLRTASDTLHWLRVATPDGTAEWQLPYPVYRTDVGDVNHDGSLDIMVGVVKSTRFHREKGRRLFIFKTVNGKPRPLWMGSKLGGILHDFRFIDGKIRALETTADGRWVVSEYHWQEFGMGFDHFIKVKVGREEAREAFLSP